MTLHAEIIISLAPCGVGNIGLYRQLQAGRQYKS